MKTIRLFSLLLISCTLSPAAFAATTPSPGPGDPRIQVVRYDPDQVVELHGSVGYELMIEFGESEHIENVAIGDSLGWQVTPNKRANLLFLKPSQHEAPTNMTVITNLRHYMFNLEVESVGGRHAPPIFRVRFDYPPPPKSEDVVVLKPSGPPAPEGPVEVNRAYTYEGAPDLIPAKVFDDGNFTYFRFAKSEDYPAIYVVESDGKESVVNFSVHGGYVVVDKVGKAFILRRGAQVTKIYNDAFKPPSITSDSPKPKPKKGWFNQ